MPATHTLNTKIEALNLLDLHDGDFNLVNSRLGIPIRTLRGWLGDEKNLRLKYDNRQYRYFANIKFKLLNRILEFSLDTMNKMTTGDLGGNTLSQLTYVLSTLINQVTVLEKSFEDLPPNPETDTEQPNRIRYVYEEDLGAAPPPPTGSTGEPDAPQNMSVREKLRQLGVWADPAPSGKGGQTPKKRRPKPKQKARQSAKRRRNRHR